MARLAATACACLFLSLVLPPAISAAPGDDDEIHASSGDGGWRGSAREWTRSIIYSNIRDYADRPDERTLTTLAIEWQKPELDALGNHCTIRGQLKTPGDAQRRSKPITWFQGVTIYMGITSDAMSDWSKGVDQATALSEVTATSPSGKFGVSFDLRAASYDRARAQAFQFGVALAKHSADDKTRQEVVWDSHTPALTATVQMLTVPAAPVLSHELQLINRASRWPFTDPNGVHLIRAVNALRLLDKERSLTVMEQYLESSRTGDYFFEQDIVFWIIRLVFEPIRLGERIPPPTNAVNLVDPQSVEATEWPLNPVTHSGDIPFMVGHQIAIGGHREEPFSHIRWARLHGVVRDDPLVPGANPLAAAEAIFRSRRFKALDDYTRTQATMEIRKQALAMVKGLIEPMDFYKADRDHQWLTRLDAAAALGIHWDATREQFMAKER
jgi:hypothetical protein